jgi:hypothetical protein
MASEIFINIKDLPEITEPSNGEYLLIETSTGTHIIDFVNFIIPTANTVITTTVEQNTTSILTLSTNYTLADAVLSASIDATNTNLETLSTSTLELSSKVNTLQNVYIGKTQITIPYGGSQSSNILSPLSTSIDLIASDFVITPANQYATKQSAYITNIDNGVITIKGGFYKQYATIVALSSKTLVTSEEGLAEEDAVYNVMAIKKL